MTSSLSYAPGTADLSPTPDSVVEFGDPGLFAWLIDASASDLDALPFGVVAMALDGTVEAYNKTESRLAGLAAERVIGKNFFTAVAPCTNNFMVAQRYQGEPDLDTTIDYVFTLRMRPQKVRLRLLRRPDALSMYMVVERRL